MAEISIRSSSDGLRREVHSGGFAPPLWFELSPPPHLTSMPVENGNFAAIALLPLAMHRGEDLHFQFPVDSQLLDGLDHYQDVWQRWRPGQFRKVWISAASEYALAPSLRRPARAVGTFSAGVDSSFMLMRHRLMKAGRAGSQLDTAVMIHGFDMPLTADAGFANLFRHGSAICAELGIDLFGVKTNWREYCVDWEMTFGAGLACILHQFSHGRAQGLIATEDAYDNCLTIWGNSYWMGTFFSGSDFRIMPDGGAVDRIERVALVGTNRTVLDHIRVCWAGPRTGENCGTCPKCILAKLSLMASNIPEPWPFPGGLDETTVANMRIITEFQLRYLGVVHNKIKNRTDFPASIRDAIAHRLEAGYS